MNHSWKAIDVGAYDTLYKCAYCHEKFMTQADNPDRSTTPNEPCPQAPKITGSELSIGNLVSGKFDKSIVQGYVTFISLRGVNLKLCTYEELVSNYFNLKECKGRTVFIKHHNVLNVYSVKQD